MQMSNPPKMVQELFEKYGRREIIRHEYTVPSSQPRVSKKPFYGACVIARTKEGEFVLIRNSYVLHGLGTNLWTLPCGRVEKNESFEKAAVRETLEETGLNIKITGLYKIFQNVQVSNGKRITEFYCAVFLGEVLSEAQHFESPEILEVRRFKKLPRNFAGELGRYYEDLM